MREACLGELGMSFYGVRIGPEAGNRDERIQLS